MNRFARSVPPTLALCSVGALIACGGSGSGPTGPSTTPTGSTTPIVSAYVGSVALPGGTGMLVVRAASSVNTAALFGRSRLLDALVDLLEPRLLAQGSTASGALTLDNGEQVQLTGTHGADAFQLSGSGGYSASVSVASGSLSGTVFTPTGAAAVAPFGMTPAGPAPQNPAGFYQGNYQMSVDGYYRTTHVTTGALIRQCSNRFTITGNVRLEIFVPAWDANALAVHVLDDWREVSTVDPGCPSLSHPAERSVAPPGPLGMDYAGDVRTIQGARAERVDANGLTNSRTHAFWGAVTGPTTIEARMAKSFRVAGTDPQGGTWFNSEGYATVETTFSLQKGPAPSRAPAWSSFP